MSCAMLFLSRKAMQSQQKKRFVCKDLPQTFPPKNNAAYCREIALSPLDCGGIDGDAREVGPENRDGKFHAQGKRIERGPTDPATVVVWGKEWENECVL